MGSRMRRAVRILVLSFGSFALSACVTTSGAQFGNIFSQPAKTAADYEAAGKQWGQRHWNEKRQPGSVDTALVNDLVEPKALDFFWVHADLKEAFKKGYRLGYQDRTADLVLGPHLTAAAEKIGHLTSTKFVDVIQTFEADWAKTLKRAVDVFITLISEGSQADRERFINAFEQVYSDKYRRTQEALRSRGYTTQTSEGGTTLYLDARNTLAVLNIPSTQTLKAEVYHQTFKVMGDEWGRRLSHNLIRRDELVDLLRRSKTALNEVAPGFGGNVALLREAFLASYGTDAEQVFRGLTREAGYGEAPVASQPARRGK